MSKQPPTDEQQQLANGLSHQTIFTEEGWKKYIPASLLTLKKMVPGISVAGNRMTTFNCFHLNTKQLAAMPGISSDSAYKIRQLLRKRLQLNDLLASETYLTKL